MSMTPILTSTPSVGLNPSPRIPPRTPSIVLSVGFFMVTPKSWNHACDDMAVVVAGDAAGYAAALLALAEQEFTVSPPLAPAAVRGKGALWRRIERLLRPPPSRSGMRVWPGLA